MKHEHSFDIWTVVKLNHPFCQTVCLSRPPSRSCWDEIKLLISNIRQNVCLSLWTLSTQISLYCSRLWPDRPAPPVRTVSGTSQLESNQQVNILTSNDVDTVVHLFTLAASRHRDWTFCCLIWELTELTQSSLYNILFELNINVNHLSLAVTQYDTHISVLLGKYSSISVNALRLVVRGVVWTWS